MTTSNPLFQQTRPYWDFLRIEKQVSPHTLSNYQRQLMAVSELFRKQALKIGKRSKVARCVGC